jgi:hypothetical protein
VAPADDLAAVLAADATARVVARGALP